MYGTVRGLQGALGKPYLTLTFRKLVLVVLNIYNTVHNYSIKNREPSQEMRPYWNPKMKRIRDDVRFYH